MTLAIAATFTVEPMLPALELVLREAGLQLAPQCAAYNQIFQQLLSASGLLATNAGGANVLLIRLEDFVRDLPESDDLPAVLERTSMDLAAALTEFAARARSPTVLALLPPSPSAGPQLHDCLQELKAALRARAPQLPGMHVLADADIDLVANDERYDALQNDLAHIPFTEEFYASMALAIARKLHAIFVPAHKVLVLDCDNTLWRGVVAEDGPRGIVLSEPMLEVQRFACRVQEAGVLVCLASKNAEGDVLEVLAEHPGMLLRPHHVVAHRINWNSKAQNIAALARELNLGLDSFVFLDDNPVECAEIHAALPQVVALQLPAEADVTRFLSNLWVFDKTTVTAEDMRRTSLYRENAARQQLEESTTDINAFIKSLQLQIDIAPPSEEEWARLSQLTQRTNQFNFTTVRRTEAQLRACAEDGASILRVRVRDRFGDYGLVGLALAQPNGGDLAVDTLLLSCRVLGRGVEHAVLRRLGELAVQQNLEHVHLPYVRTPKNEPAHAFADSVAAAYRSEEERAGEGSVSYRIPASVASAIAHRPGFDPAAVVSARKGEERRPAASASAAGVPARPRSQRYARFARELTSGRAVLEAVRARGRRVRGLASQAVAPSSSMEQELLRIWEDILNIAGIGVEDDYFALGGTSLLAVRLFAEVNRRFGVRLRLTTILEASTVSALARRIEPESSESSARSEVLIELRRGGREKLFLVHDGDGETLLYRNLAQHLPDDIAVFGIAPRRASRVPLAATRIADMARCYIEHVRKVQPHGPYLLGGLCAGGVISYEMARQLKAMGEPVKLVAILDAASPQAQKRAGLVSRQRARRFGELFADARKARPKMLGRAGFLARSLVRKLTSFALWQLSSGIRLGAIRVRFRVLHEALRRHAPWPAFLPPLSVREIYDTAEARYVPGVLTRSGVVLVRARSGMGDDTPYRDIYLDQAFGWRRVSPDIEIIDTDGGHSSMLREPFVRSLAAALAERIRERHEPVAQRRVAAAGERAGVAILRRRSV